MFPDSFITSCSWRVPEGMVEPEYMNDPKNLPFLARRSRNEKLDRLVFRNEPDWKFAIEKRRGVNWDTQKRLYGASKPVPASQTQEERFKIFPAQPQQYQKFALTCRALQTGDIKYLNMREEWKGNLTPRFVTEVVNKIGVYSYQSAQDVTGNIIDPSHSALFGRIFVNDERFVDHPPLLQTLRKDEEGDFYKFLQIPEPDYRCIPRGAEELRLATRKGDITECPRCGLITDIWAMTEHVPEDEDYLEKKQEMKDVRDEKKYDKDQLPEDQKFKFGTWDLPDMDEPEMDEP